MALHNAQIPEDMPGALYPTLSHIEEQQSELQERVVYLLNVAVEVVKITGVNAERCHMCGGLDTHRDSCPVPALESWLAQSI